MKTFKQYIRQNPDLDAESVVSVEPDVDLLIVPKKKRQKPEPEPQDSKLTLESFSQHLVNRYYEKYLKPQL